MTNSLRLLIVIGLIWFAVLAMQTSVIPHTLLDAILPPRVLAEATSEERSKIVDQIALMYAPSYLSWFGASAVVCLSSYALWKAKILEKK